MNCETFTDLIDSFLCGELAVETYHYMLYHEDNCFACRAEMRARKQFRYQLKRACVGVQVSERFMTRLRERLRLELGSSEM